MRPRYNPIISSTDEACKFLNEFAADILKNQKPISNLEGQFVKVPIYTRNWKKQLIQRLKKISFFSKRSNPHFKTYREVSFYDFSKIVIPDKWESYKLDTSKALFLKSNMFYDEGFFRGAVDYEFNKADLSYGLRPIGIIKKNEGYINRKIAYLHPFTARVFYVPFSFFEIIQQNELVALKAFLEEGKDFENKEKWLEWEVKIDLEGTPWKLNEIIWD